MQKERIKNIESYLKANEIKPSLQRMKIFKFVDNSHEHPTVELIYSALKSEIPTLSKTTVYNTLKLFHEKGVVNFLSIDDKELRFDTDLSSHGHFKCKECGKIYDYPISESNSNEIILEGFEIEESYHYHIGICNKCK